MAKYGCIGKILTHSFSKEIHSKLADYEYELIELNEDEIEDFFKSKDFNAINVTIPYKQTVIPYLDWVSDIAKQIEAELEYPGQIKINVIRETKAVEYAK